MCYHFVLKIKRSLLLHAKFYDISNEMHILNSLNVLILFVKFITRVIERLKIARLAYLFDEECI